MATVETITGPVDTADLGRTLMHEHVFVLNTEMVENYAHRYWDEEERVADAIARLNDLTTRGVTTIVDPTVIGLGRYIPRIQRIAEGIDLNIVAATGLYTYDQLPFWFRYRMGPGDLGALIDGPEPMDELFISDITDGIAGTGVKAGIIKVATDQQGLTPDVERVLRAASRAHRATGVPITTHTDSSTHRGRDQQRVFTEEGVDLTRVVIGHCGDSTDLDYLRELMDNGSLIGMDRFGIDALLSMEERVRVVAELCAEGYADRMVLSHDAACFMDWFDPVIMAGATNWHYNHIPDDVLPALQERGVTDDQIDQMLIENPKRVFDTTASGAY